MRKTSRARHSDCLRAECPGAGRKGTRGIQGIAGRGATFETEACSADDIAGWLDKEQLLIVAELEGQIAAFARTSPYRNRACYASIREFSVYVDDTHHGHGLGLAAMRELIAQAGSAGMTKLIARIFKENAVSLSLCDRLGFRQVGVYEKHGQLDGEWRDCVIVELLLTEKA